MTLVTEVFALALSCSLPFRGDRDVQGERPGFRTGAWRRSGAGGGPLCIATALPACRHNRCDGLVPSCGNFGSWHGAIARSTAVGPPGVRLRPPRPCRPQLGLKLRSCLHVREGTGACSGLWHPHFEIASRSHADPDHVVCRATDRQQRRIRLRSGVRSSQEAYGASLAQPVERGLRIRLQLLSFFLFSATPDGFATSNWRGGE